MTMPRIISSLLLALLPVAAACASTSAGREASSSAASAASSSYLPWTREFQRPALLVAEEVHIEGPPGLLEHFAVRVENEHHDRRDEATSRGYLQTVTVRPGAPAEVRAYLDLLELAVLGRLSVLERPGEVDVVVEARGEVYWLRTDTQEEHRGQLLRLVGRRPAAGS